MNLNIRYEDDQLIVVEKPAGVESQSTRSFEPDMVSRIRNYLHIHNIHKSSPKISTAGEPYVGVIHRLDKPVAGLLVYAKTKKAAASLSLQVQEHRMRKRYGAVVCGKPVDNQGTYVDYLWKDGKNNTSLIVDKSRDGAKRAELSYRVADTSGENEELLSLLEIDLKTGRHHQIRVQMAGHQTPLYGDRRYNPRFQKDRGAEHVALCAVGLSFLHPVTQKPMEFSMIPSGSAFERFPEITRKRLAHFPKEEKES